MTPMTLTTVLLFALIIVCGATDVLYGKIFNAITLPAICLGLAVSAFSGGIAGPRGLVMSLVGAAVGFFPLYIVFRLGGMGGGDVKLMTGIGALMGFPTAAMALFYSILVGGAMALIALVWKGRIFAGLVGTWRVLRSIVTPGLRPVGPDPSLSIKVPFGLAISLGTAWAWLDINIFW